MLENTGQAGTKVPNTLAIVAAQAVVEQAKKYQEQVREALERQRALERARAFSDSQAPEKDAVQVDVASAPAPVAKAEPAPAPAPAPPQASRGAAVDLNA